MKIYKYRLHCATESQYVYTWQDETEATPTTCPNDTAHTLTSDSALIVQEISEDPARDVENALLARPKQAPSGWTYELRGFEFETSNLSSLFNRDYNNSDRGDAVTKFLDSSGVELTTQASIDTDCVSSMVDLTPIYDYEIIGGSAKILTLPSSNVFVNVIAVPDISAELGGTKIMISGINLKNVGPDQKVKADGRTSKRLNYSSTTPTNKLRFLFHHPAGEKHKISIFLEHYKQ